MARTPTVNHGLGTWAIGDNSKDDSPYDLNYNWTEIDKKLYGKGSSFPASYTVGGLFLRTDESKLYENTGTQETPVWTVRIDASSPFKAKVSSNDTTPGYLNGKLVQGTNVTLTENNNGGDETLTIAASSNPINYKSGKVLAASFSGNPKKATVTLATAYANTNYSIVTTAHVTTGGNASWLVTVENPTVSSFVLNMNANNINNLVGVFWYTIPYTNS